MGVNRDVIPCGHGEGLSVERWGNIAVRSRENDEGFTAGEGLPVGIGLGEMALQNAVLAFVFHDQRKMSCHGARAPRFARRRAKKRREGIGAHGLEKDEAIVNLVEFGRIHPGPASVCSVFQ